jgi:protein subunit release factor A
MKVQETETQLEPILRARDEWERKRKKLQIAAQVARLEEDDESVTWFEQEYLAAHAMYQEACRSLKTRGAPKLDAITNRSLVC